ncbi:Cytochrome [Forsythia ovata]|uniref:Cytochrome n=1 Tax=Forsythia ovata TaxID=205694 RepID=A0ABD1QDV5_9LAMI
MEMVLTSDPANVNYILSKNFSIFQKGPSLKKIFDVLGDGIFASESEIWENQRRIAMSLINHSQFQNFAVKTSSNIVENRLIPFLEHVAELGIQVDMQELFKRYSFDNTSMLLFGRDLETLCIGLPDLKQEKAFTDMEEAVMNRHIIPEICWKFQKWLQIGHEKLREAKQVVDQFLTDFISLKCQKLKVGNEEEEDLDLLTNYMKIMAEKSSDSEEISEKNLKDELLNLAFAGKNAVSACLAWLFWLLATNPKEENKIRQEILKFSPVGKWKFSSTEELKKMVYLHGAICESLRLYPPVALQHKTPVKPDILPTGQPFNANTKTVGWSQYGEKIAWSLSQEDGSQKEEESNMSNLSSFLHSMQDPKVENGLNVEVSRCD